MDDTLQNKVNPNAFNSNPNFADKHLGVVNESQSTVKTGNENVIANPKDYIKTRTQIIEDEIKIQQQRKLGIPPEEIKNYIPRPEIPEYKILAKKASQYEKDKYANINLIIYVVPVVAFIMLILNSFNKAVRWHVRQSIVAQSIWISVFIVLTIIDLPIISDQILRLWNIIFYGFLIWTGVQSYMGETYRMPLIYDMGKKFIDKEQDSKI